MIRSVAMAHIHRDDAEERGGFNFDNVRRNEMLRGSGLAFKNAMKTGTTISGVCFAGGVVLGADTRSTNGETVADKNCEKIHYIAPNIYCCGAGTAADTEAVTGAPPHPPDPPRLDFRVNLVGPKQTVPDGHTRRRRPAALSLTSRPLLRRTHDSQA